MVCLRICLFHLFLNPWYLLAFHIFYIVLIFHPAGSVKFVTLCKLNYSLLCISKLILYRQVERLKNGTVFEKYNVILKLTSLAWRASKLKGIVCSIFLRNVWKTEHTFLWKMEHCYKKQIKNKSTLLKMFTMISKLTFSPSIACLNARTLFSCFKSLLYQFLGHSILLSHN